MTFTSLMVESDEIITDLFRNYGVDLMTIESRHDKVLDIIGTAYFGDNRWELILTWLFDKESDISLMTTLDFYIKYINNAADINI